MVPRRASEDSAICKGPRARLEFRALFGFVDCDLPQAEQGQVVVRAERYGSNPTDMFSCQRLILGSPRAIGPGNGWLHIGLLLKIILQDEHYQDVIP